MAREAAIRLRSGSDRHFKRRTDLVLLRGAICLFGGCLCLWAHVASVWVRVRHAMSEIAGCAREGCAPFSEHVGHPSMSHGIWGARFAVCMSHV